MKKKIIIGSVLSSAILTSSLVPQLASASNVNGPNLYPYSQQSNAEKANDSLQLGAQIKQTEIYALTILKAPYASIQEVPDMMNHFHTATTNARTWLDELQPQVISANNGVIAYNHAIQSYYPRLVDLALHIHENTDSNQNREDFKKGIAALQSRLNQKQKEAHTVSTNIENFRMKTQADFHRFSTDLQSRTDSLSAQDAQINLEMLHIQGQLEEKRKKLLEFVEQYAGEEGLIYFLDNISPKSFTDLSEDFLHFTGFINNYAEVQKVYNEITPLINQYHDLKASLSTVGYQTAGLHTAAEILKTFGDSISHSQTVVANMDQAWTSLNQQLNELQGKVQNSQVTSKELTDLLKNIKDTSETMTQQSERQAAILNGLSTQQ
ncbi:hypothetical protein CN345_28065 [Bacillus thuringiensis]|uniref:HBL/NHE enterotoxin family protein n=1 Tax=Bacillus thuringiensis TaxID=1428 RepID=UPI000BF9B94F|nr:HBL/NHE enterotoxin family protein [Bacillus thuringiensis]PEZ24884.1 hypothetical protein CN345_28065 [Bacillus thuringiensis]PGY52465.1 hypothetical protein COE09_16740 [Bacillus thuringiensis]